MNDILFQKISELTPGLLCVAWSPPRKKLLPIFYSKNYGNSSLSFLAPTPPPKQKQQQKNKQTTNNILSQNLWKLTPGPTWPHTPPPRNINNKSREPTPGPPSVSPPPPKKKY